MNWLSSVFIKDDTGKIIGIMAKEYAPVIDVTLDMYMTLKEIASCASISPGDVISIAKEAIARIEGGDNERN